MMQVCAEMKELRKLLDKKTYLGKTTLMILTKRFLKFGFVEHISNIKARNGVLQTVLEHMADLMELIFQPLKNRKIWDYLNYIMAMMSQKAGSQLKRL